jgi:DedD protein
MLEPRPIATQGDSAKGKPSGGTGTSSGSSSGSGVADEAAGAGSLGGAEGSGQHAGGLRQGSDPDDAGVGTAAADGARGTQNGAQSALAGGSVRPALPAVSDQSKSSQSGARTAQQTQPKIVQPAVESAVKNAPIAAPVALMVRIATLAHEEDADVLVDALRRRGYAVAAHRDLADGMVHVRIGPFASRDLANQWKQKLLNDGYNAVVE